MNHTQINEISMIVGKVSDYIMKTIQKWANKTNTRNVINNFVLPMENMQN